MAKLNPKSIVYSFEPCKKVYDILVENIKINKLDNVKAYNLAVTKKSIETITLTTYGIISGANTIHADIEKFKNVYKTTVLQEQVKCISFDEIINTNNIEEIQLLKIDCEGAEYDIIYDSEMFKKGIVKNMVGEFHNLKYNKLQEKGANLIKYCKKYVKMVKVSVLIMVDYYYQC